MPGLFLALLMSFHPEKGISRNLLHFDLFLQLFHRCLQLVILFHLALEVANGDACLLLNAAGGKQVRIRKFILIILEVLRLDPAFFNEAFEAIVCLAQTNTQVLRQLALVDLRVLRDRLEEFML